jgi:hypothetical protein
VVVLVALGALSSSCLRLAAATAPQISTVVDTYCVGCHNGSLRSPSGLLLEKLDVARIASSPELWAKAYRQLQAGAMPPVGSPRPDRVATDAALADI